jgi:hypothetical protein
VDLVVPRAIAARHGFERAGESLLGARLRGGVQLRPDNYAHFTRQVRLAVTVPNAEAAYTFAFAQIGKPYAKRRILDFFLHKFGKPDVFAPDRKHWFCDELLYATVAAGGVQLLGEVNPENLSPQAVLLSPLWRHAG